MLKGKQTAGKDLPMRTVLCLSLLLTAVALCGATQPSLTIYDEGFAVVCEPITLQLEPGINQFSHTAIAPRAEADTIMLRSTKPGTELHVLEQSFEGGEITTDALLRRFEGKCLDFAVGEQRLQDCRIIRAPRPLGTHHPGTGRPAKQEAVVEVNGTVRMGLPGTPLFPSQVIQELPSRSVEWVIKNEAAAQMAAELSYLTNGMDWHADYHVAMGAQPNTAYLTGLVTLTNNSGRAFEQARIKLAETAARKTGQKEGQPGWSQGYYYGPGQAPQSQSSKRRRVQEGYRTYPLPRPITLDDGQSLQVEVVRIEGIKLCPFYLCSTTLANQGRYAGRSGVIQDTSFTKSSESSVSLMYTFTNSKEEGFGSPLPKGRLRVFRRDAEGLELASDSDVPHMAPGEEVGLNAGPATGLTVAREQTDFDVNHNRSSTDTTQYAVREGFKLTLKNDTDEAVEIRIFEPALRGDKWKVLGSSNVYLKKDNETIEFRVQVQPGIPKEVSYTIGYY